MLYFTIATLHILMCIILVMVVLLQSGKGADLAGAFGGGATQTAFGSRGPASFLSKLTTVAAIVFMLTSIGLSMVTSKKESKSILENGKQVAQPYKAPAAQPKKDNKASAPATSEQTARRVEELRQQKQQQQAAPAPEQKPAVQNQQKK
jgi:preprotein translocase subunit SecG